MPGLPWVPPMLATASRVLPPVESDWAAEVKYDGMRAQAQVSDGTMRLLSRTGRDITREFPELGELAASAARHSTLVLDGEIIAPGPDGRPSFAFLQRRMHRAGPGPRLVAAVPVVYIAFDLLHLGGRALLREPYEKRRALLESLSVWSASVDTAPAFPGDAAAVAAATADLGLEGVVLKRLSSRYEPGRRSRAWLKVKHDVRVADVAIAGWIPRKGKRPGTAGSLLAAVTRADGLHYAGQVGSGLTGPELRQLRPVLESLATPEPSVTGPVPAEVARQAHWVRPVLHAEVAYAEMTPEGRFRQPVWRGLRPS